MSVPTEDPLLAQENTYDQILFDLSSRQNELISIFQSTMGMPLVSFANRFNIITEGTQQLVPDLKETQLKQFFQQDKDGKQENNFIPKEIIIEKMSYDQYLRCIHILLAHKYPDVMDKKSLNSDRNDIIDLWKKIDEQKPDLEKSFNVITKDQTCNQSQVMEILYTFSVFLGYDCEPARYYYIRNGPNIPDWVNLDEMNYRHFIMIFQFWVKDNIEILQQAKEEKSQLDQNISNWAPEMETGFKHVTKDANFQLDLNEQQNVQAILDRWAVVLSMDLKQFALYLEPENQTRPKDIQGKPVDVKSVDFGEMQKFFNFWLTEKTQSTVQKHRSPNNSFLGNRPFSNNDSMTRSAVLTSDTYKRNQKIVDDFLDQFQEDVYSYFCDFSREKTTVPLVLGSDVPLIMRVSFYIDNITFHLGKTTREQAFNTPSYYQLLLDKFQQYYGQVNSIDFNDIDPTEILIPFDTYLEFVYYYLQSDEIVFLRKTEDYDWRDQSSTIDVSRLDDPVIKQYKDNIDKYQKLLNESHLDEEQKVLKQTVTNLQGELDELTKKKYRLNRSISAKKANSQMYEPGKLRDMNLKQVFDFYCKQMYVHGPRYSFERHERELGMMNIANWLLFCQQFGILNHNKYSNKIFLQILFKKTGALHHQLNYDEFKVALYYLSCEMYQEQAEKYPTDMQKYEALLQHIHIDERKMYYPKMSLLQPPFNIQEKEGFRLLPKDQDRQIKIRKLSPKTKEKLKEYKLEVATMIEQIQSEDPRLSAVPGIHGQYMTPQYALTRKTNQSMPTIQSLQSSIFSNNGLGGAPNKHYIYDTYAQKQAKSKQMIAEGKISWQQLDKLTFADMTKAQGPETQFKPTDLFDENEDADDQYFLAEYNLAEDQRRKEEQAYMNMKGQEAYGVLGRSKQHSMQSMNSKEFNPQISVGMGDNLHRYHHIADDPYMYAVPNNLLQNQSNQNIPTGSVSPPQQNNIGQSYKARAAQLDNDEKKKDQEIMDRINGMDDYNQPNRVTKGYNPSKR